MVTMDQRDAAEYPHRDYVSQLSEALKPVELSLPHLFS